MPRICSIWETVWDTADWVMFSALAADDRPTAGATAGKTRSMRGSRLASFLSARIMSPGWNAKKDSAKWREFRLLLSDSYSFIKAISNLSRKWIDCEGRVRNQRRKGDAPTRQGMVARIKRRESCRLAARS